MKEPVSEASLMAYADGELDEASSEAIERAAAEDPRLARRISEFLRSRRLARAALGGGGLPEVPDALSAAIFARAVPAGAAAPEASPQRRWRADAFRRYALSAAAGVAGLAVGILAFDGLTSISALGETVALLESAAAGDLLATAASGEERTAGGARLRAVATYRLPGGEICREIHLFRDDARLDTIECREGARWAVRLVVVDANGGDSYSPAGGADDPVDAYLTRLGAGEPLRGAAEMEAIRARS